MFSPLRRSGNWADDMYIFRKKYSHLAENENHLHRSIWLIFFSEYLNNCYSFWRKCPWNLSIDCCMISTGVSCHKSKSCMNLRVNEQRFISWVIFRLSNLNKNIQLCCAILKDALYGHQQLLNNRTFEENHNKTSTPKLILYRNLC